MLENTEGATKKDNPEILANKRQRIPKGQSEMDNPEKLATQGNKTKENKIKTQHNMCWTSLCANKHKHCKQDIC